MINNFLESLKANAERSVADNVRRRLGDIETALAQGFTHRQILAQLHRDGITLTPAYYGRLITRLRAEAKALKGAVNDTVVQRGLILRGETEAGLDAGTASADGGRPSIPAEVKRDDLSAAIAGPAVTRPRTISDLKPEGPKFRWDPRGAEKIDPNNI